MNSLMFVWDVLKILRLWKNKKWGFKMKIETIKTNDVNGLNKYLKREGSKYEIIGITKTKLILKEVK